MLGYNKGLFYTNLEYSAVYGDSVGHIKKKIVSVLTLFCYLLEKMENIVWVKVAENLIPQLHEL